MSYQRSRSWRMSSGAAACSTLRCLPRIARASLATFLLFTAVAFFHPEFSTRADADVTERELQRLFSTAANLFWSVEPKLGGEEAKPGLPPLPADHPDVPRYRRAAVVAEHYLTTGRQAGLTTGATSDIPHPTSHIWTMLYLAAMSWSRIGEHEKAIQHIDRLLKENPDYRRPRVYRISDRFSRPVKAGLLHLRLYHQLQLLSFSPSPVAPQPLDILRSTSVQGADALAAVREWQAFMNTQPAKFEPQLYRDLEYLFPTPDQLRCVAIPPVEDLVAQLHDDLLPDAIRQSGAKAVRDYLRALAAEGSPFTRYASQKLAGIDAVIIAQNAY